jgi:hypothetical protein
VCLSPSSCQECGRTSLSEVAGCEGFEPPSRVSVMRFSRPLQSAALPTAQVWPPRSWSAAAHGFSRPGAVNRDERRRLAFLERKGWGLNPHARGDYLAVRFRIGCRRRLSAGPPIAHRWSSSSHTATGPFEGCAHGEHVGECRGHASPAMSGHACLATLTGLEPATSAVTGRRSNQLSYRAIPAGAGWWEMRDSNPRRPKPSDLQSDAIAATRISPVTSGP